MITFNWKSLEHSWVSRWANLVYLVVLALGFGLPENAWFQIRASGSLAFWFALFLSVVATASLVSGISFKKPDASQDMEKS